MTWSHTHLTLHGVAAVILIVWIVVIVRDIRRVR